MPDFAAWRRDTAARAVEAWLRISEQPVAITIRRETAMLNTQTVRIEMGNNAREDLDLRRGLNVLPGVQRAVIFGVRDHPTVPDTDIQRGDRFVYDLRSPHVTEFEVIAVIEAAGEMQAVCEART